MSGNPTTISNDHPEQAAPYPPIDRPTYVSDHDRPYAQFGTLGKSKEKKIL
jgi:hypothetical protein